MHKYRDLHELQYIDDKNKHHHYKEFRSINNKSLVRDLINENEFFCETGYLRAKADLIKLNSKYRIFRDV